jgi:hypothetical protein
MSTEAYMKRLLWTTLLAGLALALTTSRVAIAQGGEHIVVRPIFASDISGEDVGRAVGIMTFNTETGDWAISTRGRLPSTDANIYYPAISLGPATALPRFGRWVEEAFYWTNVVSVDGVINASGTVDASQLETINQALADGGIFILVTNSI